MRIREKFKICLNAKNCRENKIKENTKFFLPNNKGREESEFRNCGNGLNSNKKIEKYQKH